MSEQLYTQCRLERQKEQGIEVLFSWIPKKYAVQGKILRLQYTDGWVVTNIWETKPRDEITRLGNQHLHWREQTDI
jgi:hypothetical protein